MNIRSYLILLKTFFTKTKKQPIYAHFEITYRCNLRCRMCHIPELVDEEELTITQIKEIADILKSLGIIYVSLGGGEPFMREDLPEIVRIFKQRGFRFRILTNGLIPTKKSIKELASLGLEEISVSLDTLNPEKQAYICNCKEVWRKIVNSICLFSEILPKRGNILLINTVVSHLNIEELFQLAKFVERFGYYISFIPIDRSRPLDENFNIIDSDYVIIDETYDRLIEMKKRNSPIFNSTLFLEQSREYLKTGQTNWRCDAGRLYLAINPKGHFSVCHKFDCKIPFSTKKSVRYLKSSEYESKYKKLRENCSGCMHVGWAEVTNFARDKKSFWEMVRVKFSALQRKRLNPYRH